MTDPGVLAVERECVLSSSQNAVRRVLSGEMGMLTWLASQQLDKYLGT